MIRCIALVVAMATVGTRTPSDAYAAPTGEPDLAAASKAYAQAQAAELRSDFARAAELYELADSLAPSPQALRAAVRNWRAADAEARAANLALRLAASYDDDKSQELAQQTLHDLAPRLGLLEVTCSSPCTVSSATAALASEPAPSHRVYMAPGEHVIVASFGESGRAEQPVHLVAGEVTSVELEAPPLDPVAGASDGEGEPRRDERGEDAEPDDARPSRGRARLSPAYFAVGAVVTAGLGATMTWSGIDVLRRNEDYEQEPTQARFDQGRAAELRTNVLIGATAAFAITTVVLGVFTDWKRGARRDRRAHLRPGPGVLPGGGALVLGGRF